MPVPANVRRVVPVVIVLENPVEVVIAKDNNFFIDTWY
ncbi:MAG: hypothetical protein JETT_2174 [Candidatus Jettenia ecosi]|uniref:Uncharacterized protein n=1 Tax=Candidatus Jettenia ecosi TaxID=2494326 RepID=A0A533QLW0_9BACT|nr:MAG: hypothetical protein JETT_2174 [Candidatus Jettenia ecosi]